MARVRYILEVQKPDNFGVIIRTKFLLPLVSEIKLQRKHAVVTVWTLGATPVKQYAGVRNQVFTLSGRSGVQPRSETIGVTSVPAADQSGPELFRKLEKFIEDYENSAYK